MLLNASHNVIITIRFNVITTFFKISESPQVENKVGSPQLLSPKKRSN